jgi:hypothetical protein
MPARVTPSSEIPTTARAHATRSMIWWGGQSAHVVVFVIVSPGPVRSCCIFCGHTPARPNGQPGRSVVGPGWLQLGVSNCLFVTRTGGWVHLASFDFRCMRTEAVRAGSSKWELPAWQRRTNVWRGVTSPAQGPKRLRNRTANETGIAMKRCARCHGKLGLGVRSRNAWSGRWWSRVLYCSTHCEALHELERYDARAKVRDGKQQRCSPFSSKG